MDNRYFVLLGIVLVIILIAVVGGVYYYKEYRWHNIPNTAKKIAEDYLVSKVGKGNFNTLFVYSKSDSYTPGNSDYYLTYHFTPFRNFSDTDTIVVRVKNGNIDYVNGVPNCVTDVSQCQFAINRDQALSIAQANGFSADDRRVRWTPFGVHPLGFAISITSCLENKEMRIDYRNGRVISFQNEVICGGTP